MAFPRPRTVAVHRVEIGERAGDESLGLPVAEILAEDSLAFPDRFLDGRRAVERRGCIHRRAQTLASAIAGKRRVLDHVRRCDGGLGSAGRRRVHVGSEAPRAAQRTMIAGDLEQRDGT